ncbi:MAG: hypothetical protein HQ521_07015 [Bacteroidetes bacterium]|nr:hypothetical protein [Bacteroidota bacterium]
MNKILLFCLAILLNFHLFSQERFFPYDLTTNYKAAVSDNSGNLLTNKGVSVRFTIYSGETQVFSETHNTVTDAHGIIVLKMGSENTMEWMDIDWGANLTKVKTEYDTGSGFIDMGTQPFVFVPYAQFALKVQDVDFTQISNTPTLLSGYGITDALAGDVDFLKVGGTIKATTNEDDIYHQGKLVLGTLEALEGELTVFTDTKLSNINVINNSTITGERIGITSDLSGDGGSSLIGIRNTINNSGNSSHYGVFSQLAANGTSAQTGAFNLLWGPDGGFQTGTSNNITTSGNSTHCGTYNSIYGGGSGEHYGTYNELWFTGQGIQYGTYNMISNSGNNAHYAVRNLIDGNGSGSHFGVYSDLSGEGTGEQYGAYQTISNSGGAVHYGNYTSLTGSGSGEKYGVYSYVPTTAGGNHYAIFGMAEKVGSYAGYFVGNTLVGGDLEVAKASGNVLATISTLSGEAGLQLKASGANLSSVSFYSNDIFGGSIGFDQANNRVYIYHGNNVFFQNGNILPAAHKFGDLGADGQAWNNIYYDDMFNQGAAAFTDRIVTNEIVLHPPLAKEDGDFDARTKRGLMELNPTSLPDGLHTETAIITDELTTYNYKANYEQQIIINNQTQQIEDLKLTLLQLKSTIEKLSETVESLKTKSNE